jgi:hypothetical protein
MIGIALDSEQIRTAPAEVRQWIEREVIASLGSHGGPQVPATKVDEPHKEHLASCNTSEAAAILGEIQGVLPAVNVFFELGRHGTMIPQSRVEAFRLLDIAHHTRLQNVEQVIACLDMINEALGRVRGTGDATFCGFDRQGHCYVALETQQSILQLWQNVISSQQLSVDGPETDTATQESAPDEAFL